ncbi:hypothetical protein ACIBL8_47980, partial [Streptomyces sp. NPDC050523]|uniref:hypothetical protein n=1 Tax=Streptomyces sp. NPDC050523 TaxID=3365622 RepID=UPI0037B6CDA9
MSADEANKRRDVRHDGLFHTWSLMKHPAARRPSAAIMFHGAFSNLACVLVSDLLTTERASSQLAMTCGSAV